jgi:hypothetical protein
MCFQSVYQEVSSVDVGDGGGGVSRGFIGYRDNGLVFENIFLEGVNMDRFIEIKVVDMLLFLGYICLCFKY